jgi:hypothetical protein
MKRTSLLTVVDHFQISGIGLVVMPDFSVPDDWRNVEETVLVETPTGRLALLAQFSQTHCKSLDIAAPLDRRWRVVMSFPTATKEQVPVGSVVHVSQQTRNALFKSH